MSTKMTELGNPNSVFGDSTRLSFVNKTFTRKELLMLASCLLALVLCLVFIGLYGAKVHTNNEAKSGSAARQSGGKGTTAAGGSSGKTGPTAKPPTTPWPTAPVRYDICKTPSCIEITADIATYLNRSVKPCEDFHSYACGIWPQKNPPIDTYSSNTVKRKIWNENKEKLRVLLETPAKNDSVAEVKMKHLFTGCLDNYGKMLSGGNPFINKVMNSGLGGWYVFGTMSSSWNINTVLQKAHVDFWTDTLFGVGIGVDELDRTKRIIVVHPYNAITMSSFWYTEQSWPRAEKVRQDFKKLMKKVASLLVRDKKITVTDAVQTKIETFADDVLTFETHLANLTRTHVYPATAVDEERVSLGDLNSRTNNFIDWVRFFQYMFNSVPIDSNTKVLVTHMPFLVQMSQYIQNLPAANKTRILNNYFVWHLAYHYLQDLSWEYVHANREFYVDRTGRAQFLGTWRYCFNYVSTSMDVALSHLFIKDHFADDNKAKVHEIADYVKKSLLGHLTDFTWLDDSTRTYARNKVKAIVDKLGYPDFMMDADSVDSIYSSLTIVEDDYFQNVLNMNAFFREEWTNEIKNGEDRSKWRINTYASFVHYSYPWNELLLPAGVLQWPIYDYHIPHYLNFGSMGSVIAQSYVKAIDFIGGYYQINGTFFRKEDGTYYRWWSNQTQNQYTEAKQCYVDYFTNKTLGPFDLGYRKRTVPARASSFAGPAAIEVGGLKQAYYAYEKWEADNGGEPVAPGIGLTNQQMFFVSYAQTWCFARTDFSSYLNAWRGVLPENLKVNSAVSQMKEFSQAFACPAKSPMNPSKRCTLW